MIDKHWLQPLRQTSLQELLLQQRMQRFLLQQQMLVHQTIIQIQIIQIHLCKYVDPPSEDLVVVDDYLRDDDDEEEENVNTQATTVTAHQTTVTNAGATSPTNVNVTTQSTTSTSTTTTVSNVGAVSESSDEEGKSAEEQLVEIQVRLTFGVNQLKNPAFNITQKAEIQAKLKTKFEEAKPLYDQVVLAGNNSDTVSEFERKMAALVQDATDNGVDIEFDLENAAV